MKKNKENSESPMLGALPRKFTFTLLFILCYTVIHINFECNYWLTDDSDIFGKYEIAGEEADEIEVAKRVYFSKAIWMFALVWMMALGLSFRSSIAYSFMFYSVALMFLFPIGIYTFLNLLLAAGCVIEDVVDRVKLRGKEEQ